MAKVGRNDPCPCGSGKKYKNCCEGKHPRSQYVYIGYKQPFQGVTFEKGEAFVHLPSGRKVKADAAWSQTQYTTTAGKDKVLSRVPDIAITDIPAGLASNFDVILAIDTNTKPINDDMVSISSVLECYMKSIGAGQEIEVSYRKYVNIGFKNCPNNMSERNAWVKLVTMFTSSPAFNEDLRIAVITDHDRDRHPEYNAQKLPICQDFYLPPNFKLLYASSDTGKENIMNWLIAQCDKDATDILKQLEEKGTATVGKSTIIIDKIPYTKFD